MRPNLEPSSSGPDRPAAAGTPGGFERPPLDIARVPIPARVIAGAGLVYLLVLLLPWNRFCLPRGCVVATGVAGIGVLCFLLVLGLLVWELAPLLGRRWGLGASELYVTFGLTGGLFLFTVIRVAVRPDRLPRSLFGWIGLILAVGMGVGAYLRVMKAPVDVPGLGPDAAPPPPPDLADPEAPTARLDPPADEPAQAGATAADADVTAPTRVDPGLPPVTSPPGDDRASAGAGIGDATAPASEPDVGSGQGAEGALAVEPTTELPTPPEPDAEPEEPPPAVIDAPAAAAAELPDGEARPRRQPAAPRSRASRTPPPPS
jgi:hypothetical protein